MPGEVVFTFKDYANKSSTISFTTDDVNAGNIAAITSLNGALQTALEGVTLGNIATRRFLADAAVVTPGLPAAPAAQRKLKWLLRLTDSVTGELVFRELPTADVDTAGLLVPGTEEADMSAGPWVSLKSAIDGNYNNTDSGNSLLLIGATLKGRNL